MKIITMADYTPINCNLYDYLEEAATLKKNNVILIKTDKGPRIINGKIADLFIKEKVEYLRMRIGTEIRLDTIQQFNDIDFTDPANCKL